MFVSKYVVFLDKEFLQRDSESKVELGEVQDAQTYANQLPELKVVIHIDEVIVDPSEARALHSMSRIRTVLKKYGFLIFEQKDVLLIEDDDPTT